MKIQYLGHSCFLLTNGAGTRILTDPYAAIGFSMPTVCADLVTVSHGHYDHSNVSAVSGASAVLTGAGEYDFRGIPVTGILSMHDDCNGRKRGTNVIYRYVIDGISVCHLGDIGEPLDPALVKKIGKVDVLLIPVGGNYTVDAAEAVRYVKAISPEIVIPMHYKVEHLNIDIEGVERFLALMGREAEHLSCLEISSEDLGNGQKIIVMERNGI